MAKVSAKLWTSKKDGSGLSPIYLVISHRGRRATIATGHTLAKSHWNPKTGEVRRSHPDYRTINADLDGRIAEINAIITDMIATGLDPQASEVKRRYEGEAEETLTFLGYFSRVLRDYEVSKAVATGKAYRSQYRKFEEFLGIRKIPNATFEDITTPLLNDFIYWLRTEKGNGDSTVHKTVGTLRTVFKKAQDEDLVSYAHQPFRSIKLKKRIAVREKLTTDEIRKLATVTIQEGTVTECVRDMWMFAFYAGGMRFGDVATLRRRQILFDGQEWRVLYKMGKTEEVHSVLLVDEAVAILRRYDLDKKAAAELLFPILAGYDLSDRKKRHSAIGNRNAYANKVLKKLAKRAGIDKNLTFHLSRHSIAGYLLDRKTDVRAIQKVLGHASVTQTEHYLKGFASSASDDAMRGIKL